MARLAISTFETRMDAGGGLFPKSFDHSAGRAISGPNAVGPKAMRRMVAPLPAPISFVPLLVTRSGALMFTVPAGSRITPPFCSARRMAVSVRLVFGAAPPATAVVDVVVATVVEVVVETGEDEPEYCRLTTP